MRLDSLRLEFVKSPGLIVRLAFAELPLDCLDRILFGSDCLGGSYFFHRGTQFSFHDLVQVFGSHVGHDLTNATLKVRRFDVVNQRVPIAHFASDVVQLKTIEVNSPFVDQPDQ